MGRLIRYSWLAMVLSTSLLVWAEEDKPSYSPNVGDTFPRQVYWGDTHLHTNLSADANSFGKNRMLSPNEAYRFAKGETVIADNGMPVRLRRPLDFLAVADHAAYLGVFEALRHGDKLLLQDAVAQRWADWIATGKEMEVIKEFTYNMVVDGVNRIVHPAWDRSIWARQVRMADANYQPGVFTTLPGYEWTSMADGDNLHRVVLFREGGEQVAQHLPFTALDSRDPEKLWANLASYERNSGGQVFAIPHNSNLSGGLMFADKTAAGKPFSRAYLEQRARYEPLVEVTQYKGDSETHPLLSPEDEFADYETWDRSNVAGSRAHQDWMFPYEYVRSALRLGLEIEATAGVNPYRLGMVGGTDSHTGLSAADEDNFWGKWATSEPSKDRWAQGMVEDELSGVNAEMLPYEWEYASSGYVGVWALENTREAIFDAMRRKETYATTGPRMVVRFFGGWDFTVGDIDKPDLAKTGYSKGVPMGGVLAQRQGKNSPRFLISALKDPDGANLDRVQVVKGWLDKQGKGHEKVYDVVWSDHRKPGTRKLDKQGKLPAVENTVNIKTADYQNTVGAVQLTTLWTDPDFDPAQAAFYYLRVLQIPTPRWTAYDQKFFNIEMSDKVPMVTQERAYTSPIWYEAAKD